LAGLLCGVPVVATFHGDTRSSRAVRLYEWVARVLANFTRGAVAVSRPLLQTLRRWVRTAPVEFVPNALPGAAPVSAAERAQARQRLEVTRFCVAVVGRLAAEKGHRVLFDALRGRDVTILIAGDGPLREELGVAAAGLDARFLGYLEDAREVFAAADVVAIPSLREGLPLTALEALGLCRCVVASAVGELPELLREGAGVLVPAGDARALSEALRMLENGEVRAQIEERGRARATRYDVAAMAGAYASLYGRALSAPIRSQ
jgi:glycosyltransferase involved in cell wall biosynthesis